MGNFIKTSHNLKKSIFGKVVPFADLDSIADRLVID